MWLEKHSSGVLALSSTLPIVLQPLYVMEPKLDLTL